MTAGSDPCGTDCDSIDRRTALRSIAGGAALVAGLGSRGAWAMPIGSCVEEARALDRLRDALPVRDHRTL